VTLTACMNGACRRLSFSRLAHRPDIGAGARFGPGLCRALTNEKRNAPSAFDRPKVRSLLSWCREIQRSSLRKEVSRMKITIEVDVFTLILLVLYILALSAIR
jgi:hypothetical protein